jgi:hypothetical protein
MAKRSCPHCRTWAARADCVKCAREMCEDCIGQGELGPTCGLCRDREDGEARWRRSGSPLPFDEWYEAHA